MPLWLIQASMWMIISAVTLYKTPDSVMFLWFLAFAVAWSIAGHLKGGN